MTAPGQAEEADRDAEKAARTLAKGLEFIPRSILADPYAFSRRFMAWLDDNHWRCIPPAPNVLAARERGTPPTDEFKARKAAITRKDDEA